MDLCPSMFLTIETLFRLSQIIFQSLVILHAISADKI